MSTKHNPFFVPTIQITMSYGFKVTAPRNIRERIYKVLETLQDGIVKKDDSTTTITLRSNPGYPEELALHILAVATHIALVNDTEALLRIANHKEHLKQINEHIVFGTIQMPIITEKNIASWIDAYLCNKTTEMLNNSICGQFNMTDGNLARYTSQCKTIRNRIIVEVNGLWNLKTRYTWLRLCDEAIEYLESQSAILKSLVEQIIEKHKEAESVISLYEKYLSETGPVGQINVYNQAKKSLSQIITSASTSRNLIDRAEIKRVFESISTLLPSAPKK